MPDDFFEAFDPSFFRCQKYSEKAELSYKLLQLGRHFGLILRRFSVVLGCFGYPTVVTCRRLRTILLATSFQARFAEKQRQLQDSGSAESIGPANRFERSASVTQEAEVWRTASEKSSEKHRKLGPKQTMGWTMDGKMGWTMGWTMRWTMGWTMGRKIDGRNWPFGWKMGWKIGPSAGNA